MNEDNETQTEQAEENPPIETELTEETVEEVEETFPRSYVEELRSEAAEARVRAKHADDLAAALWTARAAATGRLADPTDLAMPDGADPLDEAAVTAAIDDLLDRKPHLASRRPSGSVAQGAVRGTEPVDLAGMLRSRA